jgi:hypothetical protein
MKDTRLIQKHKLHSAGKGLVFPAWQGYKEVSMLLSGSTTCASGCWNSPAWSLRWVQRRCSVYEHPGAPLTI